MTIVVTAGQDRERLRAAGLRVTRPRLAVLDALAAGTHLSAAEVYRAIAETLPGTSLQAVYQVLGALEDGGLVRRIEPAGSPARYERRIGDNHHHLICSACGAVADVDCVVGSAPCLTPASDAGFVGISADVTFWGLCPACQPTTSDENTDEGNTP